MNSKSHTDRFAAEYWQTKIRRDRLHKMIIKHEAGTLPFTSKSPIVLLKKQELSMEDYLRCLEMRAEYEGIELDFDIDAPEVEA